MSKRDSIIKATASALQAPSLDLTKFRQKSIRERELRARPEDAAGALAFAAMDQFEGQDGKPASANDPAAARLPGDELATLLLRMKYAGQFRKEPFTRAHLLLLRRYGGLSWPPSKGLFSVAAIALFEWIHDECPKCRKPPTARPKVTPCPSCWPSAPPDGKDNAARREAVTFAGRGGRRVERLIATPTARPGCPTCQGRGRVFAATKDRARGMQCVSCRNTGRVTYGQKQRWRLVAEYAVEVGAQVTLDQFKGHWAAKYWHFIDALRAIDKRIAAGIDLFQNPSYKRTIEPAPRAGAEADTEEAETGSAGAPDEPAEPAG